MTRFRLSVWTATIQIDRPSVPTGIVPALLALRHRRLSSLLLFFLGCIRIFQLCLRLSMRLHCVFLWNLQLRVHLPVRLHSLWFMRVFFHWLLRLSLLFWAAPKTSAERLNFQWLSGKYKAEGMAGNRQALSFCSCCTVSMSFSIGQISFRHRAYFKAAAVTREIASQVLGIVLLNCYPDMQMPQNTANSSQASPTCSSLWIFVDLLQTGLGPRDRERVFFLFASLGVLRWPTV